ncbi:MAG: MATE family efflux transporter [Lachnospiraceae bacterium]|jgi:putative MATE family efflux protein|nr:MATE family efflux transporter [Lachnospiraceae bacterium]
MRKDKIDMLQGNIWTGLLAFTIPLMLTNILQLMFNAADMIVVGRFVGKESLAAVGSTTNIIFLMTNLFVGISVGANVVTAQCIGEGDRDAVRNSIRTAVTLSLLGGCLLLMIGQAIARPLLELLGSPADVIDKSEIYLRVYFCGLPVMMLYNFSTAQLRAFGDTKRPMYYLTMSGIVNLILNVIFVVAFGMDTFGVGLATVISQAISAILTLRRLNSIDPEYRMTARDLRMHGATLLRILKVGIPAGLQNIMFSIANLTIQSSINSFGSSVMAAATAASNVENVTYLAMNAFQYANISFVGQNYGAGNLPRIRKIMTASVTLAILFGLVIGYASIAAGPQIFRIYTKDPEVLAYAVRKLWIINSLYFLSGIQDAFSGGIKGFGYSFIAMVNALLGVCLARVIYIRTVFAAFPTFDVLFAVYPVSFFVTAVLQCIGFVVIYRRLSREQVSAG